MIAVAAPQRPRAAITPIAASVTGVALSPEFLLAAACCRWPPSEQRAASVRAAVKSVTNWDRFLLMLKRQRVIGLADHALQSAKVVLPPDNAYRLKVFVRRLARRRLRLIAETIRLQNLFVEAGIPVVILKGAPLEQLAYGSLCSKQTRDIDLLLPPECAEAALQLIERDGYSLSVPAKKLSKMQRRAFIRYGREIELLSTQKKLRVELQWRAADNPLLLKGITARSPTQSVALSETVVLRTLSPNDLFAYLCVHGALHSWALLKWLADLNALITTTAADVEHLYRHAQKIGAGICAAQGLLLCHRLLGLNLPTALAEELETDKRHRKLVGIAMEALATQNAGADIGMLGVARELRNQFLIGRGLRFYVVQTRLMLIGVADIVRLPLPRPLHFIYPLLRLPLWLWRRMKIALSSPRLRPG